MFGIKISFDGRISPTAKNVSARQIPVGTGAKKMEYQMSWWAHPTIACMAYPHSLYPRVPRYRGDPKWQFLSRPKWMAFCISYFGRRLASSRANHRRFFSPKSRDAKRNEKKRGKISEINFLSCAKVSSRINEDEAGSLAPSLARMYAGMLIRLNSDVSCVVEETAFSRFFTPTGSYFHIAEECMNNKSRGPRVSLLQIYCKLSFMRGPHARKKT